MGASEVEIRKASRSEAERRLTRLKYIYITHIQRGQFLERLRECWLVFRLSQNHFLSGGRMSNKSKAPPMFTESSDCLILVAFPWWLTLFLSPRHLTCRKSAIGNYISDAKITAAIAMVALRDRQPKVLSFLPSPRRSNYKYIFEPELP